MPRNDVPHRLRFLREERHLSRTDLARISGVPARTIESYEVGDTSPTLRQAQRLAVGLGVTLDAFAGAAENGTAAMTAQERRMADRRAE